MLLLLHLKKKLFSNLLKHSQTAPSENGHGVEKCLKTQEGRIQSLEFGPGMSLKQVLGRKYFTTMPKVQGRKTLMFLKIFHQKWT